MTKLTFSLIVFSMVLSSVGFAKSELDPKAPAAAILVKTDSAGNSVAYKAAAFDANTLQGDANLAAYVTQNAIPANEIKDAKIVVSTTGSQSELDRVSSTPGFWGWRVGAYWNTGSYWGWGYNNVSYAYNYAYSWNWTSAAVYVPTVSYYYPTTYYYSTWSFFRSWW